MRLRQIALVARDLDPAVEALCGVLGIEVGFRDPGVAVFGLRNAVMPVGNTFLEVVSPDREGTTAGRYLERRKGDGGYMVILQTSELARERRRVEQVGVRVVWEIETDKARAIHLHPRDVGGAILSFDEMLEHRDAWEWAGPEWRSHVRVERTTGIVAAELQSEDPDAMASHWSEILGRPARGDAVALEEGTLRFVEARDGRGDGLGGIDVAAPEPDRVLEEACRRGLPVAEDRITVAGTRIRIVPAPGPPPPASRRGAS